MPDDPTLIQMEQIFVRRKKLRRCQPGYPFGIFLGEIPILAGQNKKEYKDTMTEIPIAPVMRIIRKTGADRVGNEAGEALADLMEQYGQKIAKEALKLASHAGRKTITAHDIKMAAEFLS